MSKQLAKSTLIVGLMTLLSRLLGFARDILIARLFGVDAATDAFFVAFKIPNFLRRLFAEGALAQAFVPVLADAQQQGSREALKNFIDRTFGTLLLTLTALTVIGMVIAPLLISLFAPGFGWESEQHELATTLLRITFPYLLFITLVAFAGSILNAQAQFAISAFTPSLLNISLIIASIWGAPLFSKPIMALAYGVLFAGVIQWLWQTPALIRLGLLPRLKLGFDDSGVRQLMTRILPTLFGSSVTQINLLLNTFLASFLVSGSISWLYYADRLIEFPLGVCGVALSTAILPSLAKHHTQNDELEFSKALDWGLQWVIVLGLPASLGLLFLAEPIVITLFQYDAFSANDALAASKSLMAYSFGLLGFILIKVLIPGFSSRQDAIRPVRFGIYSVIFNVVASLVLIIPFAHVGLALATSLAAYFNAGLLLGYLLKTKIYRPRANWLIFSICVLAACIIMSLLLYTLNHNQNWLNLNSMQRVTQLLLSIVLSLFAYITSLACLGLRARHFAM